jgi:hypothetical protein
LNFDIVCLSPGIIKQHALNDIMKCNDFTVNYGLILTEQQAVELVETRIVALSANGRIEFGGGVINRLINMFCDSPFITMHNYSMTMHELIEMFYYYKNETLDLLGDDELIRYMKLYFDGTCQGSLELLSGRELARLARNIRSGYPPDYNEERETNDEGEGEEEHG